MYTVWVMSGVVNVSLNWGTWCDARQTANVISLVAQLYAIRRYGTELMTSRWERPLHKNVQCWPSLAEKLLPITHDDVIKWKHFPRNWTFVRGIHRSLVDSPHKGQWRGALMLSFICTRTNGWANNRGAGDLRRHNDHGDVNIMPPPISCYLI